jgi:predicted O-methyltransferase YrrM
VRFGARPVFDPGEGLPNAAFQNTRDAVVEDFSAWFAGKNFTCDWVSQYLDVWSAILSGLRDKEMDVLEIGCFEGRSVVFWLEYLRRSRVTCIDPYQGWTNEPIPRERRAAEPRFDANVAGYGARVTKLKMRSASGLDLLRSKSASFDLIYIDGDHTRAGVMVDSLLSWPLLRSDGILIWDDYLLRPVAPAAERPQQAIDLFLQWHGSELKLLHKQFQMIVKKLA